MLDSEDQDENFGASKHGSTLVPSYVGNMIVNLVVILLFKNQLLSRLGSFRVRVGKQGSKELIFCFAIPINNYIKRLLSKFPYKFGTLSNSYDFLYFKYMKKQDLVK